MLFILVRLVKASDRAFKVNLVIVDLVKAGRRSSALKLRWLMPKRVTAP